MHAGFLERALQVEVTDMHTKADMVKAVTPAAKPSTAAAKVEPTVKTEDGSKVPSPGSQALKIMKPATKKGKPFVWMRDDYHVMIYHL
jgi:hypothetical protein